MTMKIRRNITTRGNSEDAYTFSGSGETIENLAHITTFGRISAGIRIDGDGLTIRNAGSVETHGDGATAVVIVGDDATIINDGKITTTGTYLARGPGPDVFADAMSVTGDRFDLVNNASISVGAGDGSSQVISAMIGTGDDGTVSNAGHIEASTEFGSTVGIDGSNGFVANDGTIVVTGDDNQALFGLGTGDTVVNRGRIEMAGDIDSGLSLSGSDGAMTNEGTVVVRGGYAAGMFGFGDRLTARNGGTISIDSTPSDPSGSFGSSGAIQLFGTGNSAENSGTITTSGDFALGIQASRGAATLVNSGSIVTTGDYAIGMAHGVDFNGFLGSRIGEIANSGSIHTGGDGAAGVLLVGRGGVLHNSGTIETSGAAAEGGALGALDAAGVFVSGQNISVINEQSGVIKATADATPAVSLNLAALTQTAEADTVSRLVNHGTIQATVAIEGGDGVQHIVNHGLIDGAVVLGGGDDTFVSRGGELSGTLSMGAGDDLIVIGRGSGALDILDFEAGADHGDVLDLSAFGFHDLNAVEDASRQIGDDVFIRSGDDVVAVLRGVALSMLVADDFVYAPTGP